MPGNATTQDSPGPMTRRGPDGRAHETPEMEERARDAQREPKKPVPVPLVRAPD